MDNDKSNNNHTHSYAPYIIVWLALLILTGLTVAVAGIDVGGLTVAIALLIASVKAYLVLTVFMHLRSEGKIFMVFVLVAAFFLIISFILLFSDYSFQ